MGITETDKIQMLLNYYQDKIEIHDACVELWRAVLVESILDLAAGLSSDYLGALRWVEDDLHNEIYSFLGVCRTLNLDPGHVRKVLLAEGGAWREKIFRYFESKEVEND